MNQQLKDRLTMLAEEISVTRSALAAIDATSHDASSESMSVRLSIGGLSVKIDPEEPLGGSSPTLSCGVDFDGLPRVLSGTYSGSGVTHAACFSDALNAAISFAAKRATRSQQHSEMVSNVLRSA